MQGIRELGDVVARFRPARRLRRRETGADRRDRQGYYDQRSRVPSSFSAKNSK